jgi:hypothetical protein
VLGKKKNLFPPEIGGFFFKKFQKVVCKESPTKMVCEWFKEMSPENLRVYL